MGLLQLPQGSLRLDEVGFSQLFRPLRKKPALYAAEIPQGDLYVAVAGVAMGRAVSLRIGSFAADWAKAIARSSSPSNK